MAFDANGLRYVRARLEALVRDETPPLLLEDAVGLTVFELSMEYVRFFAPKGPPLDSLTRAKCESIALEIVAYSHIELLHHAKIVPVLANPRHVERPTQEWWKRWFATVNRLAETAGTLDDRGRRLARMGRPPGQSR